MTTEVSQVESIESSVSKLDRWVSLFKNVLWLIGIILLGMYKFQQLENQNNAQDLQLEHIRQEHKYMMDKMITIEQKQTGVLIRLGEITSELETEKRIKNERPR